MGTYQQTLDTYGIDGPTEICLNSSDGDSVHILTSQVKDPGNCDAYPEPATGTVAPIDPVTVCCL